MPNLGYSFNPSFENAEMGRRGGEPPVKAQQSLQTINYQLPARVAGAPGGLSPLQGQDQAGQSRMSAVIASVLRTVLGPGADLGDGSDAALQAYLEQLMSGQGQGGDGGAVRQLPTPVIHPGGTGQPQRGDPASIPGLETAGDGFLGDRTPSGRRGAPGEPPFLSTGPVGTRADVGQSPDYLASILSGQQAWRG